MKKVIIFGFFLISLCLPIVSSDNDPIVGLTIFVASVGVVGKYLKSNFYDKKRLSKEAIHRQVESMQNKIADESAQYNDQALELVLTNSSFSGHAVVRPQSSRSVSPVYTIDNAHTDTLVNLSEENPMEKSYILIPELYGQNKHLSYK